MPVCTKNVDEGNILYIVSKADYFIAWIMERKLGIYLMW